LRNSSYSSQNGACVEVATNLPGAVAVRDSKDPEGPGLLIPADAAVANARRPEHYRELHHLLRLWRLRAAAYADPGYEGRLQAMQDAVRGGRRDGTPIEDAVPDWAERVAAARRRADG
jgi:hypothetical protein